MAKSKATKQVQNANKISKDETSMALSNLKENPDLRYKVLIHVLLHDLCNLANDPAAEVRTLSTTEELYISAPYFTSGEAALIKTTLVLPPTLNKISDFEALEPEGDMKTAIDESTQEETIPEMITIGEAIKTCLQNFFEKRRASGDARPCGPHDMGPIYRAVFGITKEELRDEKFLGRLRRAGLPQPKENAVSEQGNGKQKKRGGKKR